MSALGQKRTCAVHQCMSALPPIATPIAFFRMSALGQKRTSTALFDHFVGSVEEPFRNRQGECLSGLEIDHELELGWLLHRQIGRLFTFKDAIDIGCGPPK